MLTKYVLAPATAKNVISVGATETRRAWGIPDNQRPCATDYDTPEYRHKTGDYDVLAFLSRRGTIDGRFKPDLVAPGTLAVGPMSTGKYAQGSGYCFHDPNWWYHGASGTSFTAPMVSGAVALLRSVYGVHSPAMYKAMLVGAAQSITGNTDNLETQVAGGVRKTVDKWPNAQQGFGRLMLDTLLNPTYPVKSYLDQPTALGQGSAYSRIVTVADSSQPVRIVLAWTDPPALAPTTGRTLVNDLSLDADLVSYRLYGNFTDGSGFSVPPGPCGRAVCFPPSDTSNNVEVINVPPSAFTGGLRSFAINVRANLNFTGNPPALINQDFAVFVMNGTIQ